MKKENLKVAIEISKAEIKGLRKEARLMKAKINDSEKLINELTAKIEAGCGSAVYYENCRSMENARKNIFVKDLNEKNKEISRAKAEIKECEALIAKIETEEKNQNEVSENVVEDDGSNDEPEEEEILAVEVENVDDADNDELADEYWIVADTNPENDTPNSDVEGNEKPLDIVTIRRQARTKLEAVKAELDALAKEQDKSISYRRRCKDKAKIAAYDAKLVELDKKIRAKGKEFIKANDYYTEVLTPTAEEMAEYKKTAEAWKTERIAAGIKYQATVYVYPHGIEGEGMDCYNKDCKTLEEVKEFVSAEVIDGVYRGGIYDAGWSIEDLEGNIIADQTTGLEHLLENVKVDVEEYVVNPAALDVATQAEIDNASPYKCVRFNTLEKKTYYTCYKEIEVVPFYSLEAAIRYALEDRKSRKAEKNYGGASVHLRGLYGDPLLIEIIDDGSYELFGGKWYVSYEIKAQVEKIIALLEEEYAVDDYAVSVEAHEVAVQAEIDNAMHGKSITLNVPKNIANELVEKLMMEIKTLSCIYCVPSDTYSVFDVNNKATLNFENAPEISEEDTDAALNDLCGKAKKFFSGDAVESDLPVKVGDYKGVRVTAKVIVQDKAKTIPPLAEGCEYVMNYGLNHRDFSEYTRIKIKSLTDKTVTYEFKGKTNRTKRRIATYKNSPILGTEYFTVKINDICFGNVFATDKLLKVVIDAEVTELPISVIKAICAERTTEAVNQICKTCPEDVAAYILGNTSAA